MDERSPGPTRTERQANATETIDVGRNPATDTCRVGVLSPHNSKETKAILNAVAALDHEPVWIRDTNAASWITDGAVRLTPRVDVLINRLLLTKSDQPLEDLQLASLYAQTVPVVNTPAAVERTIHKYAAGVRLATAGLPIPDAYFGRSSRTINAWSERLAEPVAHKRTIGTNGNHMSIATEADVVSPQLHNSQSFVQEYLDQDVDRPHDVRVYVVGDDIVGAMRRYAPEDDWRTNVALGGDVEDITAELGTTPRNLAIEATEVLGLDLAGVDLLPIDGEWYILEVNATAGFKGLFDATGVSAAPAIARLAIERAGGYVDDAAVAELNNELDDSVPACRPPLQEEDSETVLGYTTEVGISGGSDAATAIAKADTGAKRTSLDTELAGRIGAGPLVGTTQVRTGSRTETETRPLVEVDLRLNDGWRTVTASITDRSDMQYPVLLGRDVLEGYTLDIGSRVEE
ncbi:MAG: RimK/LysX family protein [Halobacteriales archaeon]|nr:RimK/LysX family protein [Halobacteriales archaeon]